MTRSVFVAALACTAGCSEPVSPDDPFQDPDGDGLVDVVERDLGTDPQLADTDGDGYRDGDEVWESTDPTDDRDRIYEGRWPYWRQKDEAVTTRRTDMAVAVGKQLPRYVLVDQHGEAVDLYDFGGAHQEHDYLLLHVAASWCGSSNAISAWVAQGDDEFQLDQDFREVRAAIDAGRLAFVTVLTQNDVSQPPVVDDLAAYDDDYRHRLVPILADDDGLVEASVVGAIGGWPGGVLVRTSDLTVVAVDFLVPAGLESALAALMDPSFGLGRSNPR